MMADSDMAWPNEYVAKEGERGVSLGPTRNWKITQNVFDNRSTAVKITQNRKTAEKND